MATRDFLLPDVGEGLTEAEIVRWHVQPGDEISVNEPLVEIETAKALVELPSPQTGRVVDVRVPVGQVVPVGTVLVTFDVAGALDGNESPGAAGEPESGAREALLVGYGVDTEVATRRRRRGVEPHAAPAVHARGTVRAKPPVRQLASRLGIDLARVAGSGPGGIVTRDDVQRAVNGTSAGVREHPVTALEGDVRTPATAVQRAMADAMTRSALLVPQASVWLDVDVTDVQARVAQLRSAGMRASLLLPVAFSFARALDQDRGCACVWDAGTSEIVHRRDINLGIAVASPRGLLVPNIKAAQSRTLPELAAAITELTETARAGRTTPADMAGGTATITNVGVFGVDGGIPLLNPGESGILAMGQAAMRPWVVDGELRARSVLRLSLAFDHRVIDGQMACTLLAAVGAGLGAFALEG